MGKKTLQKFKDNLLKNLLEELVFYIPDSDFTNSIADKNNLCEFKQFFGRVIYFDEFKGPLIHTIERKGPDLFRKSSLLEKNIINLIDKREKMSLDGIKFIIDHYKKMVYELTAISEWLSNEENLNDVANLNQKSRANFRKQLELLKEHKKRVRDNFEKEAESVNENDDILKIIELQLPSLIEKLNSIEKSQFNQQTIVEQISKRSEQTSLASATLKTSKKKVLITEVEAEEFLLESVFGIKLH